MENCKSAERKHNWLGISENWHLTLTLGQLTFRRGRLREHRHSSSAAIINDRVCVRCPLLCCTLHICKKKKKETKLLRHERQVSYKVSQREGTRRTRWVAFLIILWAAGAAKSSVRSFITHEKKWKHAADVERKPHLGIVTICHLSKWLGHFH